MSAVSVYFLIRRLIPRVRAAKFQKVSEEGTGLEVWPFAPGFVDKQDLSPL